MKVLWYLQEPGSPGQDLRRTRQARRYLEALEPKSPSLPLRPLQKELERQRKTFLGRAFRADPGPKVNPVSGQGQGPVLDLPE